MRDIKFRAWFKGANDIKPMMCDVVEISKTSDHYDTYMLDSSKTEGSKRIAVPVYRVRTEESKCELMQFTGLYDKNGKEIYEGDILKRSVTQNKDYHGDYAFHEVINKNGILIASYLKSEKHNSIPRGYIAGFLIDHFDYDMKMFLFFDDYEPHTAAEIVGNIYENPELIKEEKEQ